MFEQVSDDKAHGFEERWWALVRRLLAASEKHSRRLLAASENHSRRLPREVVALPDHLLLDIGIDPRCVPNPLAEEISRPDLALNGLVPARYRSTAKS